MKSIGEKIQQARKRKGWRLADLGDVIGLSISQLSSLENDQLKGGASPDLINRISDALDDNSIRLFYLETNPVFQAVIPRIFPELNNIRTDPAIVFSRFADEADEAARASRVLSQLFAHADPRSAPEFDTTFSRNMEQIIDLQRCAEILMTALISAEVMTEADRRKLNEAQQRKCERKGHHHPELGAAAHG